MAEYEDVEDEGLDSAARKSSWLNLCSSWRGLCLDVKVEYSSIFSRNSLDSAKDFRRNYPLVATSRAQAESLSKPSKKLHSNQDGSIDRIGPDIAKSTNLHHAMPMGSFLLTLLSAPDLYTASARFRVAFPSEYSPKVYQSTEQVYYYA